MLRDEEGNQLVKEEVTSEEEVDMGDALKNLAKAVRDKEEEERQRREDVKMGLMETELQRKERLMRDE